MIWHPFDRETAPKDRPIAILIPLDDPDWITIEICQWHHDDGCDEFFILGRPVCLPHPSGTHWCEVEELELPKS
jgi:hypothetical protein